MEMKLTFIDRVGDEIGGFKPGALVPIIPVGVFIGKGGEPMELICRYLHELTIEEHAAYINAAVSQEVDVVHRARVDDGEGH